jgi:primosomal protein N' (replication factor Y)
VGPVVGFLATASPPTVVEAIPAPPGPVVVPDSDARWMTGALDPTPDGSPTIVRLPPATDPIPLVLAAARRGDALVLVPTAAAAARLATRVRRSGIAVATMPRDWARAAAGGMVIGSRAAALAPVRDLRAVVVLDEHDEAYQEERAPTWNARDLVVERARRAGVPCVLASASPTLEALAHGRLLAPSRAEERTGWPVVDLLDRRLDDPVRSGLFSPKLVPVLRGEGGDPVVCVLNRKGRSRLLACDGCGELARCEEHRVPMVQDVDDRLRCPLDDDHGRPVVCDSCGATRFRNLRAGVSRVREELEALAGRPVLEVTAETDAGLLDGGGASVFVGTEAVLHRIQRRVARVVFLEFDQELLAPRMRASEQAMALLVRASRLLGPRSAGGRLVVQTRQPDHEVLQAVLQADPGRLVPDEKDRRSLLGQPPFAALARVSGAAAPEFMTRLGSPDGIDVMGPRDGSWLVRAPDHDRLSDALLAVSRPAGRLRLEVDPRRA